MACMACNGAGFRPLADVLSSVKGAALSAGARERLEGIATRQGGWVACDCRAGRSARRDRAETRAVRRPVETRSARTDGDREARRVAFERHVERHGCDMAAWRGWVKDGAGALALHGVANWRGVAAKLAACGECWQAAQQRRLAGERMAERRWHGEASRVAMGQTERTDLPDMPPPPGAAPVEHAMRAEKRAVFATLPTVVGIGMARAESIRPDWER